MTVPPGAQLSEDGFYWWDGNDWQPVGDNASVPQTTTPSTSDPSSGSTSDGGSTSDQPLSEDGNYRWDGTQWQPVDGAGAGSGGADGGGDGQGGTSFDPSGFGALFSLREVQDQSQAGQYLAGLGVDVSDSDQAVA